MSPPNENLAPELAGRVLLGFLRAGRVLDAGSSALLLSTVLLALRPAAPLAVGGILVALLLALVEKYFAWRVALDAEFFALLHEQPTQTAAFDAALAAFLGRTTGPAPAPRPMASRWLGARRLVWRQALAGAAQFGVVLALVAAGLR